MFELDDFVQPDIAITIDQIENDNYKASIRRPPKNRAYEVRFPSDITRDSIETRVVNLRAELTSRAKDYNQFLDPSKADLLSCDPEKTRPLWNFLASWGRDLHSELFNINKSGTSVAQLAKTIRQLPAGAQLLIDAPRLVIPWGLLYEGELPEGSNKEYVDILLQNFWGFRYQIELQPPQTSGDYDDNDFVNLVSYLDNSAVTRLTFSINKKSDTEYKTEQMKFFSELGNRFIFSQDLEVVPSINTCRDTAIKSMIERKEPHHLFYFFCHHTRGEGITLRYGSKEYKEQTRIMMDGDSDGVIKLKELKQLTQEQKLCTFKCPPLIFLNACDSGQLEMGDPSGFMEYFMNDLHSIGYIGTEANVPALFADNYGRRFVEEFFQGKTVGTILR